jgi:NAD(P)H dehydrogenase (quinone)
VYHDTNLFAANGDGSRQPTEKELSIAKTQGENFARLLNTYHRGIESSTTTPVGEEVTEQKEEPAVSREVAVEEPKKTVEEPKKTAEKPSEPVSKKEEKSKCFCI